MDSITQSQRCGRRSVQRRSTGLLLNPRPTPAQKAATDRYEKRNQRLADLCAKKRFRSSSTPSAGDQCSFRRADIGIPTTTAEIARAEMLANRIGYHFEWLALLPVWKQLLNKAIANSKDVDELDPTTAFFNQLHRFVHSNEECLRSFQYDDATLAINAGLVDAVRAQQLSQASLRTGKTDDDVARGKRMDWLLPHLNKIGVLGAAVHSPAQQVLRMYVENRTRDSNVWPGLAKEAGRHD